jgi:hypothetical protein
MLGRWIVVLKYSRIAEVTARWRPILGSVHPEMVDCGPDQGCSVLATAGVAALRRGLPKRENTGLGRKMPFLDEH